MWYERTKELTGLATLGCSIVAVVVSAAGGRDDTFVAMALGVATLVAALASIVEIGLSRKLSSKRRRGRIFFIYAREDLDRARALASDLKSAGFKPWIDVDELQPGERWRESILRALQESQVALVLVSEHFDMKGPLEREVRTALAILRESGKGLSLVIPIRLGPVEVPSALREFQWVDLSEAGGFAQLRKGLARYQELSN